MSTSTRDRIARSALCGMLLCAGGTYAEGIPGFFDAAWRGFDTGYYYDSGSPHTMALADLDGDGDTDVVAGREYHWLPGITIIKSHGDGTYAEPVHHGIAQNDAVGEVEIADIDMDGDPDIVATIPGTSRTQRRIGLWRNNGDGTFGARQEFSTWDAGPVGLVIADFDRDGFPDVVTANRAYAYAGTTISWLRHNGLTGEAAGFLVPLRFEISGSAPTRLATADLDGDEWPDLAVSYGRMPNAWCDILINDHQDGFVTTATFDVGGYAEPFVGLEDLDNDGDADLLTGSYDYTPNSAMLYIQRNQGDGTFTAPESYELANADWPRGMECADINDDGFLDVLCAHPNGRSNETWSVLLSDGTGGFSGVERYPSSQNSYGIGADDVDGDGDLDVLSLAMLSNALTVHLNQGDGTFPRLTYYQVDGLTTGIDAGDIDHDGDLDLVTAGEDIYILRNYGDGTFEQPQGMLSPLNPWDIKLRDLNGDGYVDILVGPDGRHPPYDFGTALNRGDGTFLPGVRWGMNACGPGDVDAFDLDNDGDLDVVFAEELACAGQYNGWAYIARNRGDGTFDQLIRVFFPVLLNGIDAADLNHDGNLDLITHQAPIGVALGNGDLTFQDVLLSGDQYYTLDLADMNDDGELDATWVHIGWTNVVGVSLGNGDGTFQTSTVQYEGSSSLDLGVGIDVDANDIDGDGDQDVVITNYASNDLSLFINNGDGTLQPQARYGPGINPFESVVADFTGDGVPDVATIADSDTRWRSVTIVPGTASAGLPGDLDGDGLVNVSDILLLLAAWGPCEAECPEDLDGDGLVGFGDLLIILANWS